MFSCYKDIILYADEKKKSIFKFNYKEITPNLFQKYEKKKHVFVLTIAVELKTFKMQ